MDKSTCRFWMRCCSDWRKRAWRTRSWADLRSDQNSLG